MIISTFLEDPDCTTLVVKGPKVFTSEMVSIHLLAISPHIFLNDIEGHSIWNYDPCPQGQTLYVYKYPH